MIKTALQIKTIGAILKDKRVELKLEIKQISEIIKIRADYLIALEEGNYKIFPSEVYLKGFLKNYAKYLGVGTDKALALYRRENEKKESPNIMTNIESKNAGRKPFMLTPNKVITMIAAVAIFVIVVYLAGYAGKVLKKPDLKLTSPVAFSEEGSVNYKTDANFIELAGTTEIGSKLTINGTELKLNNFEKFNKEFPLLDGPNSFVLASESQFGRIKTITLNIQKEASAIITPTPANIVKQMDLSIEIVDKDTQLTVFIDDEKRTERLYKVGSTLEFTAVKKIEVRCSKQTSLKVKINEAVQSVDSVISTWELIDGVVTKK